MLAFIVPLAFVVGGMLARDVAGDGASIVQNREAAIVGVASVIDGYDRVSWPCIGLEGIDAPESKQTCIRTAWPASGQRAALHLSDRIGRLVVAWTVRDRPLWPNPCDLQRGGEDLNG